MESISSFITKKLKLKVNGEKSAVAKVGERGFLGFSFLNRKEPKRRIAPKAIRRFKERVRGLTRRTVEFKPQPRSQHRAAKRLLRLARSCGIGGTEDRLTNRTAVYGPVRTVV